MQPLTIVNTLNALQVLHLCGAKGLGFYIYFAYLFDQNDHAELEFNEAVEDLAEQTKLSAEEVFDFLMILNDHGIIEFSDEFKEIRNALV